MQLYNYCGHNIGLLTTYDNVVTQHYLALFTFFSSARRPLGPCTLGRRDEGFLDQRVRHGGPSYSSWPSARGASTAGARADPTTLPDYDVEHHQLTDPGALRAVQSKL